MADALKQGRVLVDREGRWSTLTARPARWRRRADTGDVPLEQSMPDLDLS